MSHSIPGRKELLFELVTDPFSLFGSGEKRTREFTEIAEVVRQAFGSPMTDEDIYNHLVHPEIVYILRQQKKLIAMGSFTPMSVLDQSILYIEGVAIHPLVQAGELFQEFTSLALDGQKLVALRTQNPRMYRAFQKICTHVCPSPECKKLCLLENSQQAGLLHVKRGLAGKLGMEIDDRGVARRFYPMPLYTSEPYHPLISPFFKEQLELDYLNGDSVLCVGSLNRDKFK